MKLPLWFRFSFHLFLFLVGLAICITGVLDLIPDPDAVCQAHHPRHGLLGVVGFCIGLVGLLGTLCLCWPKQEG